MARNAYLSILTVNTNGVIAPIKGHVEAEWITKQGPCISCLQETHCQLKDTHRLKVRR